MTNELTLQKNQEKAYWNLFNSYKVFKNIIKLQTFKYANSSAVNDLTHLNKRIKSHRARTIALRDATYALRLRGFDDSLVLKKKPDNFDPSEFMPNWLFKYKGPNYYFDSIRKHEDWGGWYQLLYTFGLKPQSKYLLEPELCGYEDNQVLRLFGDRARTEETLEGVVAVDLETTSLSPTTGEIIEIGIVYWPPGVKNINKIERFSLRFDLDSADVRDFLGTGPTHIHGIYPKDIIGKPKFSDPAVQEFLQKYLCSGHRLIIHNSSFEFKWLTTYLDGFYEANVDNYGMQDTILDSSLVIKGLVDNAPDNRLETFIEYVGYDYKFEHSAMADAMMSLLSVFEVHKHLSRTNERLGLQTKPDTNIDNYDELLTKTNYFQDIGRKSSLLLSNS